MDSERDERDGEDRGGAVVVGLAIMGMGAFLLLSRLGILDVHVSARHIWPFIVLGLGLVRMITPGHRRGRPRSRRSGAWLVYIGLWGMVSEFQLFGLDYDTSWPLLIIAAGLGIIWRAFENGRDHPVVRQS